MEISYSVAQSLLLKTIVFFAILFVGVFVGYLCGKIQKTPRQISSRMLRRYGEMRRLEREIEQLAIHMDEAIKRLEEK